MNYHKSNDHAKFYAPSNPISIELPPPVSLHFRLNNSLSTRLKHLSPRSDESKSKLLHTILCNSVFAVDQLSWKNRRTIFFFFFHLKYACWRVFSRKVKCHSEYNPTRKPITLLFPLSSEFLFIFLYSLYSKLKGIWNYLEVYPTVFYDFKKKMKLFYYQYILELKMKEEFCGCPLSLN